MHKVITTVLLLINSIIAIANSGHYIGMHINGYTDSVLFLTSYYGEKIYLVDSAYSHNNNVFEFQGDGQLPAGMYMAVSSKKEKLFEFLVSDQQKYNLYTDTSTYVLNMKVHGSPENKIFFDFVRHSTNLRQKERKLTEQLKTYPDTSSYRSLLQNSVDSIKQLSNNYTFNIVTENPDLFVSSLLNAMREVSIPDSINETGNRQIIFSYYKNHYWDYFKLNDARLLRTPLYSQRVDQYLSQLVMFHPDSVIVSIDYLIDKARPSLEAVSWLVWHFVTKYQNPDFMGFDKVFVHMVDAYISKEEINNSTPSIIETLEDRANKLRPLLLGQPAPNLILIDTSGAYYSFQSMQNDYLALLFWDYDCGICTKEIYVLQQIQQKANIDLGVYAISINGDLDKWKQEIRERKMEWINVNGTRSVTPDFHDLYDAHGTPVLYLLDKERKIIAKNIGAEKIETFLENYTKMNTAVSNGNEN